MMSLSVGKKRTWGLMSLTRHCRWRVRFPAAREAGFYRSPNRRAFPSRPPGTGDTPIQNLSGGNQQKTVIARMAS